MSHCIHQVGVVYAGIAADGGSLPRSMASQGHSKQELLWAMPTDHTHWQNSHPAPPSGIWCSTQNGLPRHQSPQLPLSCSCSPAIHWPLPSCFHGHKILLTQIHPVSPSLPISPIQDHSSVESWHSMEIGACREQTKFYSPSRSSMASKCSLGIAQMLCLGGLW